MKLHRLDLTNYRGIAHREVVLPDAGVIIVSGANEIGKSSMIEAIDLLLEHKDRSTKKCVKAVKPTHADVGTEVSAEISSGPYRFVYRKRFHKRCETELTVLSPRREQLTGDEAHERVAAILSETVDTELWRAQRVLQTSSPPVDLSACDALSRALDVAAGQSTDCADGEPLIDRVGAEYARYFTATGRPTGEWAAASRRLADAEAEVARCRAAVAEVDECLLRHAEATEQLTELVAQHDAAQLRLAAASAQADAVTALTADLARAQTIGDATDATAAASRAALAERRRLSAEAGDRAATVERLAVAVAQTEHEQSIADEVSQLATNNAELSTHAQAQARERMELARSVYDGVFTRDEANRLGARLRRIDAARLELERVETQIMTSRVTDDVLRDIDTAIAAVEHCRGQVALASAQIEVRAQMRVQLQVTGATVTLEPGECFSTSVAAATDVELPGTLSVRVVPGAPAGDRQGLLELAVAHLTALTEAAGVTDGEDAHAAAMSRRELVGERDRLVATVCGLGGDESCEQARTQLAALRAQDTGHQPPDVDVASARAELDSAAEQHRTAVAQCDQARDVAAAAAVRLSEKSTCMVVSRDKLSVARSELEAARRRLDQQRAALGDDELGCRALADDTTSRQAGEAVAALRARLAEMSPEQVTAAHGDAEQHAAQVATCREALVTEGRDLATALRVYGSEGRMGRLDAAEVEYGYAQREYHRIGRRARAAQLLRSVLLRHRDTMRLRYVEPYAVEVQRLGGLVFGDSFEVDIDKSLRIRSRTLAGRTVPYDSLSGGAKEQLGIIARLAGAALVAKEDSVPVVIDDALGFSDAARLASMGAAFDAVGGDGQVLVLTCTPQRYDSVHGAHRIELTA